MGQDGTPEYTSDPSNFEGGSVYGSAEQISEVTVAQYDLSTLRSDLEAGAQIASVSLEVDGLHGGSPLGDGPVNVIAYATNSPPSTADLTAPGTLAGIITADEPSEVEDDDPELGHYSVDVTQAVEAVANASGMLDLRFQPGSDEWADMYLFNDPPGSELQRETELVVTFAAQQIYPTITPTLDGTPGGGASVDYTLTGTLPPAPEADIDLYWAPTQNFDSGATETDASVTVEQTHDEPVTFTTSELGTPPPGTKYLLAVADPDHDVTDPDSAPLFAAIPYAQNYPVITPTLSWLPDGNGGVSVDYTVKGDLGGQQANVDLYWSPSQFFGDGASPARDPAGNPAELNVQQTHDSPTLLTPFQLATPPPGTKYLLAVADPDHDVTDPNSPPTSRPSRGLIQQSATASLRKRQKSPPITA